MKNLHNLNKGCTFVLSNNKDMTKFLVKERVDGWVMLTGVLKGQTFKAQNGFKQDIRFLTKDERMFDAPYSAKIHADMLNNIQE
jgi:hypothetical protein